MPEKTPIAARAKGIKGMPSKMPEAIRVAPKKNAIRKEMEHEFESTEQEILKAMNERYEFGEMKREHNRYILEFFNRNTKDKKNFTIAFEENYVKLKHLWETEEE